LAHTYKQITNTHNYTYYYRHRHTLIDYPHTQITDV